MFNKKKTYLVPAIGFAIVTLIGTILLWIPQSNNLPISFKDALYVSISAISCTGLSKVIPMEQFNILGQLVMAVLMEIGALGFVIFISYAWAKKEKKIKFSDIIMINDNISSDNYTDIRIHSIFIFNLMLKIQIIGTIFLSIRFVPEYGLLKGIWYSIFHTISTFANSGFDIIGNTSMIPFENDIYTQIVLIALMVMGSVGVFVIGDLQKNKLKNFRKLKLQTKIILTYTLILLIVPTILLKIFEPNISIINGLFMSATCRSTGFSIINLQEATNPTKMLLTILMFIGGSPASTAGGVRVVAIAIIISTMIETLKGNNNTIIFGKKISEVTVRKSIMVCILFIIILIIGIMIYSYSNENINVVDIALECVSALTNTGLSATDTENVNIVADFVIMALMYIGRIGPIAMIAVFLDEKQGNKLIDYPTENVIL